jgi:tRNA(Ile)-lysidine synthase
VKQRPSLVQEVRRGLQRWRIGSAGLVVAVSGGPDSVALLRALLEASADGTEKLVIAHLNHQLRGEDSNADEAFVRSLHSRFIVEFSGLELRCGRVDVKAQARTKGNNVESVARRLRYQWLQSVARETGLKWVVTGHTADDQAETVLHRLLRGTGLKGLRGIASCRDLGCGVQVVRPMLSVRRTQVLAYLEQLGQSYRLDHSNLDPGYTRNRIRLELLPQLAEQYNPQIVAAFCRLAEQAGEAHAVEEEAGRALLTRTEYPRAGKVLVFDRRVLAAAAPSCVRVMWRVLWAREGWPTGSMDADAWTRLVAVTRGVCPAVDLPGGIQARCRGNVVQVKRSDQESTANRS